MTYDDDSKDYEVCIRTENREAAERVLRSSFAGTDLAPQFDEDDDGCWLQVGIQVSEDMKSARISSEDVSGKGPDQSAESCVESVEFLLFELEEVSVVVLTDEEFGKQYELVIHDKGFDLAEYIEDIASDHEPSERGHIFGKYGVEPPIPAKAQPGERDVRIWEERHVYEGAINRSGYVLDESENPMVFDTYEEAEKAIKKWSEPELPGLHRVKHNECDPPSYHIVS